MIGDDEPFDVLVVGAGPAGLGVGVALRYAGVATAITGHPPKSYLIERRRMANWVLFYFPFDFHTGSSGRLYHSVIVNKLVGR
jgi:NADPH-dependent 2,4-dienoyl-CoA reductase/sulfur reductase-like enzyme